MKLRKLEQFFYVEKLIFHSLDLALYNVSAIVEGKEHMIEDEKGMRLTAFNILSLQKKLVNVKARQQVIRQHSAYDEMIGGANKTDNMLEVPLGDNQLY